MAKNRLIVFLFVFVSVVQNVYFYIQKISAFAFMIGFSNKTISDSDFVNILILLAPIVVLIYFFSDALKIIINGYGKVLIVRHFSKRKIIIKVFLKIFLLIVFFSGIQILESFIFTRTTFDFHNSYFKSFIVYIVGVFAIVALEMFMTLYIESYGVCIALIVFLFFSYIIKPIAEVYQFINFIFFPCLLFNDYSLESDGNLNFIVSTIILSLISFLFIISSLRKLKIKDIF